MHWLVALRLGRVSNLPTVWSNTVAALALSGAVLRPNSLALLIAGFSAFYVGGMFLNDAFDHEFDRVERPERPIPSGAASLRSVFVIGFGLLAVGNGFVLATCLRSPDARLWPASCASLLLTALIVYYDADHKHNALSPLIMGLCRVGVYVTGAYAVTSWPRADLIEGALGLLSYLVGLTYAAKQENKTGLDRQWPLVFLFLPLLPFAVGWSDLPPALRILVVAFLLWILRAVLVLRLGTSPKRIPVAVVSLIAGISLWDALMILKTDHGNLTLVALGCFAATRLLQRVIPGT